jgi:hypothetical protein
LTPEGNPSDFPVDISGIDALTQETHAAARDSIMSMANHFQDPQPAARMSTRARSPPNFKPMLDEDEELKAEKQRIYENQPGVPQKAGVRSDTMSIYKHKNQNSVFYVKQESKDIFILDFKKRRFSKETLKMDKLVPKCATSVQKADGSIVLFGGFYQGLPLKNTWIIDEYLEVTPKVNMSSGRACTPAALIYDRFVLACGGLISMQKKQTSTTSCELFDSANNKWYNMPKLNKERATTSACAFNSQGNFIVYVFPGSAQNSWATVESFDTKGGDIARMQKSAWILH